MTTKLKPCPFCGGKASLKHVDPYLTASYEIIISCNQCSIAITDDFEKEQELIKFWNTRYNKYHELLEQISPAWLPKDIREKRRKLLKEK